MEKKLAVIVDNNEEITTREYDKKMCSCGTDVVMEMGSPESDDTCGNHSKISSEIGGFMGFEV